MAAVRCGSPQRHVAIYIDVNRKEIEANLRFLGHMRHTFGARQLRGLVAPTLDGAGGFWAALPWLPILLCHRLRSPGGQAPRINWRSLGPTPGGSDLADLGWSPGL